MRAADCRIWRKRPKDFFDKYKQQPKGCCFLRIFFYGYKGFLMGMVDQSSITSWDISSMLWG